MSCEQTVTCVLGPLFFRPFCLERAGDKIEGHAHNFDHVTFLYRGGVRARVTMSNGTVKERDFIVPGFTIEVPESGLLLAAVSALNAVGIGVVATFLEKFLKYRKVRISTGPAVKVFIAAGLMHEFTALTDDVGGECVYTHRDPETGDVVQAWNGWEAATH